MTELLKTEGINLAFGSVVVADNINFILNQGERLAVIGQNGAGKTTFINICTGLIRPQSGRVFFAGEEVTSRSSRQIVNLGMVRSFQLPQLFGEHTVRECVELAWSAREKNTAIFTPLSDCADRDEIDSILTAIQLFEQQHCLAASLSEGQKKLLDIAMALILRPKLLIMDEPTSGVSSQQKHSIMQILMGVLEQYQVTSIFVEHDIDIVKAYSTRVVAWISGAVAADGPPEAVLSDPMIREAVLGGAPSSPESVIPDGSDAEVAGHPENGGGQCAAAR